MHVLLQEEELQLLAIAKSESDRLLKVCWQSCGWRMQPISLFYMFSLLACVPFACSKQGQISGLHEGLLASEQAYSELDAEHERLQNSCADFASGLLQRVDTLQQALSGLQVRMYVLGLDAGRW